MILAWWWGNEEGGGQGEGVAEGGSVSERVGDEPRSEPRILCKQFLSRALIQLTRSHSVGSARTVRWIVDQLPE